MKGPYKTGNEITKGFENIINGNFRFAELPVNRERFQTLQSGQVLRGSQDQLNHKNIYL